MTRILDQPHLELVGLHCHIGSQIATTKPYVAAVRRMVGLLARIRDQHGITLPQLDIGGGHAIAYRPGDEQLNIPVLAGRIRAELEDGCARTGLPVPRLTLEPGRAIVGPAGVAVYRVLAVKRTGDRTFVAVDGGMSDNPRPALYGVRYAPRLIGRPATASPRLVTVVVGTARRATSSRTRWRSPAMCTPGTCWPYRRRGRITCRWRPVTTSSAVRRSSRWRTGSRGCWSAASPWTT